MAAVSLSAIVTGARLYADRRPGGSDEFISDTEATSMVARSITRLRNELKLAHGHEIWTATSTFSTAAGTADYNLPDDHQGTVRVRVAWSTRDLEDLDPYEQREESDLQSYGEWGRGTAKGWRLTGKSLQIYPTPTTATQIQHLYVQRYNTSTTTTDLYLDGWEEWVMLDVASMMLRTGREPHADIDADRDRLLEQLKTLAQDRAENHPIRIVDVQPEGRRRAWWPTQRAL